MSDDRRESHWGHWRRQHWRRWRRGWRGRRGGGRPRNEHVRRQVGFYRLACRARKEKPHVTTAVLALDPPHSPLRFQQRDQE
jgi:hypothetical protein